VKKFKILWEKDGRKMLGGEIKANGDGFLLWRAVDLEVRDAALAVLDLFYADYGGIWTGCFKFDRFPQCRGALAAASLVTSMHML
jgi:hypothetical protein